MANLITFDSRISRADRSQRLGVVLSVLLHSIVLAALLVGLKGFFTSEIVAAGPGEGGEGGGGSIEVGVTDKSAILGFAKPEAVSYVGDTTDAINNARLEKARKEELNSEALLPPTEKDV